MSDDLQKLHTEYVSGHVTRRELLVRAAALGLSAPAIAAFIAACGSGGGTPAHRQNVVEAGRRHRPDAAGQG